MNPEISRNHTRRTRKPRPRLRKFAAVLLAALFPGAGHLFMGLFIRGVTFILLLLLDISAMLYVSSEVMRINVPLLVLLGMFIPVLYFYNVYDVLQSADYITLHKRKPRRTTIHSQSGQGMSRYDAWETGILFSLLLVAGGALMILFRIRPRWLEYFLADYGFYLLASLLVVIGLLLFIRELGVSLRRGRSSRKEENNSMHRKFRVGRYTASLLLLSVGILLFMDLMQNTDYMMGLLTWWPMLFVGLGLEYLLFCWLYLRRSGASRGKRLFRPDLKGLLMSVLLCASVFIITQQEHYMYLWNRVSLNLTTASMDFSEEEGNRIDKGSVLVPVGMQTAELLVEGVNGDITVRRAAVQDVEIHTTMWIDQVTSEEAKAIADASMLETSNGNTIRIWTSTQGYGASGKRQPLMNMEIVLPEDRRFDMDIGTSNGDITLTGVNAINSISLQSGNGDLTVNGVIGDVRGTTLNGTVNVHGVTGNVELNTNRGNMLAGDISGSAVLNTMVGSIQVARTEGDITVDTKNGNIGINGASWNVKASSLNGGIAVQSNSIGGDWDIYSAVGDITLRLPVSGSFRLEGSSSYGDIYADAPFQMDGKKVSGQVGDGQYSLLVEGNSDLTVRSSEVTQPQIVPSLETPSVEDTPR